MIKELGILCKYIKMMNDAGVDMLIEAAKDIVGRNKFRKEAVPEEHNSHETDLSELDEDFEKVLSMVNRPKECGYAEV